MPAPASDAYRRALEAAKEAEERRKEAQRLQKQEAARRAQEQRFKEDQQLPPEKRKWIKRPGARTQARIPFNTPEARLRIRLLQLWARGRALHAVLKTAESREKLYRLNQPGRAWIMAQDRKIKTLTKRVQDRLSRDHDAHEETITTSPDTPPALVHNAQREIHLSTCAEIERAMFEEFIEKFVHNKPISPDETTAIRKSLITLEETRQKEKVLAAKHRFEASL